VTTCWSGIAGITGVAGIAGIVATAPWVWFICSMINCNVDAFARAALRASSTICMGFGIGWTVGNTCAVIGAGAAPWMFDTG